MRSSSLRSGPRSNTRRSRRARYAAPLTQRFAPSAVHMRLHSAAQELHDAAEAHANAYVEGLLPPGASALSDVRHFLTPGHHICARVPRHARALPWPPPRARARARRARPLAGCLSPRVWRSTCGPRRGGRPAPQRCRARSSVLPPHVDPAAAATYGRQAHRAAGARRAEGVLCERAYLYVAAAHPVLSWLSFTVTLSALAAGLLNFGDRVGRVSAALFSFVGTWTRSCQPWRL